MTSLDASEAVARARANVEPIAANIIASLPRWQRLSELITTWFETPLADGDGLAVSLLASVEEEHGAPFPDAVWELYAMLGGRLRPFNLIYQAEVYETPWFDACEEAFDEVPDSIAIEKPADVSALERDDLEEDASEALSGTANEFLIVGEGVVNGSVAFLQLVTELDEGIPDPSSWLISLEEEAGARTARAFSDAIADLVEMDLRCTTPEVLAGQEGRGCLGKLRGGVHFIDVPDAVDLFAACNEPVSTFEQAPLRRCPEILGIGEDASRVLLQGSSMLVADHETAKRVIAALDRLRG